MTGSPGGDALLDERRHAVQERLGAGVEDGFVAEGVGGDASARRKPSPSCRCDKLRQCGGSGWPRSCSSACLAAAPAQAADPGRWKLTGTTSLPLVYYQGVTVDPARNLYFDGVFVGLYRTDAAFTETGRTDDVIPPDVHAARGLQPHRRHQLGPRGGRPHPAAARVLRPGGPNGGNPCLHGSIGVADPGTLQWRYYVKLDPAEIPKAMWNEVSPDGTLLWTSSGDDLLAYRDGGHHAPPTPRPTHAPIHSVRRLRGRGAAERDHRRDVRRRAAATSPGRAAGRSASGRSTSPTASRRLEIERRIVGESEGLVTAAAEGRDAELADPAVQPRGTGRRPTAPTTRRC